MPRPSATAAALYCRLSRRPNDGKVMTVAEQERILRLEAQHRGLDVRGVYVDNGASAFKKVKRPGFIELVSVIERKEVGYVLMVALDRATRRVADLAMIREAAEDAGVLLVADGREYHPRDDALSLYLFGFVAEQESRDKSRRVLAAKERALELGLYNGGRRPFGFTKPPGAARGYWKQQPDEAKAIRAGVRMVLSGRSLQTIAEDWNARNLPRPQTERPWTASKVRRALLSPIVAGLRTHHGEVVGALMRPDRSPWPAILTSDQRDEVERTLRSGYGRKPKRWHTPNPGLLSGLAVCGRCGHNLTPRRYGGQRPDAYTCQVDGGGRCGGVGVSLAKVDELVTADALHSLDSPVVRRALARPRKAAVVRGEDNPVAIQAELEELATAAGQGQITVREFLAARGPLDERLKRALAALDTESDGAALAPMIGKQVDVRAVWDRLDLDGRRGVLAALIEKVTVAPANGRNVFDPERVAIGWRV